MRVKMYFKRRKVSQSLRDSLQRREADETTDHRNISISFHVEARGGGGGKFNLN